MSMNIPSRSQLAVKLKGKMGNRERAILYSNSYAITHSRGHLGCIRVTARSGYKDREESFFVVRLSDYSIIN